MIDSEKILIISSPSPITGGGNRSFQVLKRFRKYLNVEIEVVLSPNFIKTPADNVEIEKNLNILEKNGIDINKFSLTIFEEKQNSNMIPEKNYDIRNFINGLFPLNELKYFREYANNCIKSIENTKEVGFIYSHHECLDASYTGFYISNKLQKPYIILLQLEPYKLIKNAVIDYFSYNKPLLDLREIINLYP